MASSHLSLYRKYRSQTFQDLVGQDHVVKTLQSAVDRNTFHHAYLFTGPRGTGKTSTARLLAKALNCVNGPTGSPCGECDICVSIAEGNCIDVFEMDAASEAGVEDVRERIVNIVEYRPVMCRFKVFIIDEAHDLSSKAFDALLKTIEEPPGHIVFIFATTELHKVPPTILSRCQRYSFHRASMHDLTRRLEYVIREEGYTFEPAVLSVIARMADGGFRDALSFLEQALVTCEGELTLAHVVKQLGLIDEETVDRLLRSVIAGNGKEILQNIDAIYAMGRDARGILESMLGRLADLTRAHFGEEGEDAAVAAATKSFAAELGQAPMLRLRMAVAGWLKDVRDVSLPKLWLESNLISWSSVPEPAPAPVAQTRVAAPAGAEHPRARPASDAPSTAVVTPPPPPTTQVTAAPPADPIGRHWHDLCNHFSTISRSAGAKLKNSQVLGHNEDSVQIGFQREFDRDSIVNSAKLLAAIQEDWAKRVGGNKPTLEFVLNASGAGPKKHDDSTVELPLQGDKLEQVVRQELEGF